MFQSKLVYTGHIYPFTPVISEFEYDQYVPIMVFLQTFVQESNRTNPAPFWMGEFGTNTDSDKWRRIVRFLREFDLDWSYWPIDGYQFPGDNESYGILMPDFATVRHDWKLKQLQEIMEPNSTMIHEPCV